MVANAVSDREAIITAFDAYDAACEQLAGLDFTRLTPAELFELQSRREHRCRTTAVVDHRILAVLQTQATPKDIGARTWSQILITRMQISQAEASRRLSDAQNLGPRYGMDGELLEPALSACAAALAAGAINDGHVKEIRSALSQAAKYQGPSENADLERILVRAAAGITPHVLREVADHALQLLNQDGDGPDPAAHKRGIRIGRQDPDGLTYISGWLDAEPTAYLKTLEQVWAAPGINNPDDAEPVNNPVPNPLLDEDGPPAPAPEPEPSEPDSPPAAEEPGSYPAEDDYPGASVLAELTDLPPEPFAERRAELDADDPPDRDAADADAAGRRAEFDAACGRELADTAAARDTRTKPQRLHDAFKAVLRNTMMSGQLGRHAGLPVTVVVSTTLAGLQNAAGLAHTSAGTMMPMRDLIRLAAHAHHYLLVYREHTAEPLYLARSKRLASSAQRLVMISRDRGCTMPGCPVAGGDCQGMHAEQDCEAGGHTDITGLGLGCGWDNRLAYETGWDTSIGEDGRVHWHPPPLLDVGQPTLNYFHHPEELLGASDKDPRPGFTPPGT
ncbi:DUF222 domain-containing protein [Mycobacterium sp. AMU20-3851]|uniref:DUF222 domain-containing protein n=1 Tax=Mycobacterium sp. AMU20-3851 TaxID=3122055 RepID=UPI00375486D5